MKEFDKNIDKQTLLLDDLLDGLASGDNSHLKIFLHRVPYDFKLPQDFLWVDHYNFGKVTVTDIWYSGNTVILEVREYTGKNGPPDHFGPILTDLVKALIFRSIPNISNPGEGWSTLPAFPISTVVNWESINYKDVGTNILRYIDSPKAFENDEEEEDDEQIKYKKHFFGDFANVLFCFTLFEETVPQVSEGKSINEQFDTTKEFKKLGMHVVYQKLTASQCKAKLEERLSSNKDELLFHYDFYNNSGLFDVKKIIDDEMTYIIQYQNKELRRGIVIETGTALHYSNWLENNKWDIKDSDNKNKIISFRIKKEEEEEDDLKRYHRFIERNKEKTFYYSIYTIDKEYTLGAILTIMQGQILNEDNYPQKDV